MRHGMWTARTLGAGMIAGAALGYLGSYVMRDQKKLKKKASKAMHAASDFIDDFPYMFD